MPTQPRARAPAAPRRCSSRLYECGYGGREGRSWKGDRMGVGQHLQHLLICITTDTLLDQVNGARNNKGGRRWFPGGALRSSLSLPPTFPRCCGLEVRPLSAPWLALGWMGVGRGWGDTLSSLDLADTLSQPPTSLGPRHTSPTLFFSQSQLHTHFPPPGTPSLGPLSWL